MFLIHYILSLMIICNAADKPLNILFVVSDDLRTEIGGPYGQSDILYTPNFEAFMDRAFTFTHAYTQQAICAATRASFLTGTRPDTTRIWNIGPYFRDTMIVKNVTTLPQYFKENGNYYTIGAGKIFHPGSASGGSDYGCYIGSDEPWSWSTPYYDCCGWSDGKELSPKMNGCTNISDEYAGCYQDESCIQCLSSYNCWSNNLTDSYAYCPADCDDKCFIEPVVADKILNYFQQYTSNKTLNKHPFFIGVGFQRPHLAFDTPTRYYDMYPNESVKIATNNKPPKNMPIKAFSNCTEIKTYLDVDAHIYREKYYDEYLNKTFDINLVNESYQTAIRKGYYAAVTFVDNEFGRIMQGLYKYGLYNNTIIVLTGDHGWHLGEQGAWSKFTNFEVGVRVPLIIRVPGLNEGKYSDVLVEQLDMFPTLVDLTIGFTDKIKQQLEGKSLANIIRHPNEEPKFPQLAYSQYPRGGRAPNFTVMGLSMRNTEWRYTEWVGFNVGNNASMKPYVIWDKIYGIELYNHSNKTVDENDLNGYDNYNFAYEPEMQSVVQQLHNTLYNTWDNQTWGIKYQYMQNSVDFCNIHHCNNL